MSVHYISALPKEEHVFTDAEVDSRVDFRTGEILDSVEYESSSFLPQNYFTPEELACHNNKTNSKPTSSRSWSNYLESHDRRLMRTVKDFRKVYGLELAQNKINNRPVTTTAAQAKLIEKLIGLVQLKNYVVMTQKELASSLGVSRSNLLRTLAAAKGAIRVATEEDGMTRGDIRVEINPAYVYRWYTPSNAPDSSVLFMQQEAIKDWLSFKH